MRAMIPRITSFAATPAGRSPSTVTAMLFGFVCGSVCVASTCSTSDVPMPNASAPNAPWVEVWLSPHTIVMPGCVSPSSGPITWTMPWVSLPNAWSGMPKSRQFVSSCAICVAACMSMIGKPRGVVGVP